MSFDNQRDARVILARDKHFTMRPKPLERWLWTQRLSPATERVYWLHWEAGQRQGDWCSEMSLREVARECCVDPSTVTRAYQILRGLGLIRREEPGRDPNNPFRQEIAVTEVLVPRELITSLGRFPNRARPRPIDQTTARDDQSSRLLPAGAANPSGIDRQATSAAFKKLSAGELSEYHKATQNRAVAMVFDTQTRLTPEERGQVLSMLARMAATRPPRPTGSSAGSPTSVETQRRKLTPLMAARVRASVAQTAPEDAEELFRQVLWSMEQGALSKHPPLLALNIALKKIRGGAWTRPNRLPSVWLNRARSETCGAA